MDLTQLPASLQHFLLQYLDQIELAQLKERTHHQTRLTQARATYHRAFLPLHLLASYASCQDGKDQERRDIVGKLLCRALTGKTTSTSNASALNGLLERLYIEHHEVLSRAILPPFSVPLVKHLQHQTNLEDSLRLQLHQHRNSTLNLYSSLQSRALPSPPDLSQQAAEIKLSTSTLKAAEAKYALLLYSAEFGHLTLPGAVKLVVQLNEKYEEERRILEEEIMRYERELKEYEDQLILLESGKRGTSKDKKRGESYSDVLQLYQDLSAEEKELKADLRKLGWKESAGIDSVQLSKARRGI